MNSEIERIIDESSVLKIGSVTEVKGRIIQVQVDREKNTSHLFYQGKLIKSIVVGSYVKITKGFEELVGKIEGEHIEEDIFQSKKDYKSDAAKIKRILNISLLGYFNGPYFKRGIKELPLIDNECFLLDESEFNKVHDFIKEGDTPLYIGHLAQEKGMPIRLGVNGLFASHIGIFGNTGSGKSYTLANLYREVFKTYKDNQEFQDNASFFLIDFNGEYIDEENREQDNIIIEREFKNTYRLSTRTESGVDKFPVPTEVIHEPLIWTVLLEATEKTQKPFITNALKNKYIAEKISAEDNYKDFIKYIIGNITKGKDKTIEKKLITNFLRDIQECNDNFSGLEHAINEFDSYLKYHNTNNEYYFEKPSQTIYASQDEFNEEIDNCLNLISVPVESLKEIELIRLKIISNYYNDVVRGYSNREHISPLIGRLKTRIPDLLKVIEIVDNGASSSSKNFTIVSLKDIKSYIRK